MEERSPMKTARLGFGCLVDNYGEKIYAIGGSLGKNKATTELCEVYNIEENKWSDLAALPEARFS
jgi:hypothetical protein